MDSDIPISVLHEKFEYCPITGNLRWRVSTGKASVGKIAGCKIRIERNEYLKITINKVQSYAHRIVWAMVNGYWPIGVDHQDGNGLNNRIHNLREATDVENGHNRSRAVTNTSGTSGVVWIKQTGKWRAGIKVNQVYHSLGSFVNIEDAIKVRKEAEVRFGFHPNHDR
jgi:hypothetical protein